MPEGLEAEIWCRAARVLVGRRISSVWCDPRVAPDGLAALLVGADIVAVERCAKVVQIVTIPAPTSTAASGRVTLGVHFGMTGRLEVDGNAPIVQLEYASGADRREWDRLRLSTEPVGPSSGGAVGPPALRMNDPRRLGRLSLNEAIVSGPDLFTLTTAELERGLNGRRVAVKTALLDQTVVAGLGNLCADEVLFWAGVAPGRVASSLNEAEVEAIAAACRSRLPVMLRAGGSTHGALSPEVRAAPMPCPRDGAPMVRTKISGRTAVWCPRHQTIG